MELICIMTSADAPFHAIVLLTEPEPSRGRRGYVLDTNYFQAGVGPCKCMTNSLTWITIERTL